MYRRPERKHFPHTTQGIPISTKGHISYSVVLSQANVVGLFSRCNHYYTGNQQMHTPQDGMHVHVRPLEHIHVPHAHCVHSDMNVCDNLEQDL